MYQALPAVLEASLLKNTSSRDSAVNLGGIVNKLQIILSEHGQQQCSFG